jgi:hypothetical protein
MPRMADTFQSRQTDVENRLKDQEVFSARLSGTSIGGADMPRKPRFASPDDKQIRVTAEAKQAAADAVPPASLARGIGEATGSGRSLSSGRTDDKAQVLAIAAAKPLDFEAMR